MKWTNKKTVDKKSNKNDHMDETEIIILNKRRSNIKKPMTPGGINRLPNASSHGFLLQTPRGRRLMD
jgi:hypothetical protein